MPTRPDRASGVRGSGVYLLVTVVALLVAVYLALQVIGFLLRLLFLVASVAIAVIAWRAWKESS